MPPTADDARLGTRLRIRPARARDLDALVALEHASFSGDRMSVRQWRHHLTSPRATVLVAVERDRLLGAALSFLHASHDIARLYSLATAESARGRGVGRRLLEAIERAAIGAGRRRLRLEVREDNLAARRLYEHDGYRCIGRRAAYYEDGEDALRFEKDLGSHR